MNIKKTIFQTRWVAWIILAVLAELLITGGLLSFSFYLSNIHRDGWSEIFGQLGVLSLGLPFLFLFHTKKDIVETHERKEKIYKVKNLFFLSKKEMKSGVDFNTLEKEV
jgi:hypothetical protein